MTTRYPGGATPDDELAVKMLEPEEPKPEPKPEVKEEDAARPRTWEENLKAAGLTIEQALEVLDAMMERGYYEVNASLYGGRVPVTLRTREGYARVRVVETIDQLRTNDSFVHSQTHLRMNLAGSLVRHGKTVLPTCSPNAERADQERAFATRLAYVERLPEAMLDALYALCARFDARVYAALADGAPAGF